MDEKQQYLMQLQMLEHQANEAGEQLKIIDQQVKELNALKEGLTGINETKESEMFAEIGKGVYIKTQLKDKEFLIDAGSKIFVPKSYGEVQKIINEQIGKFEDLRKEIGNKVELINSELNKIVNRANHLENNCEEKKSVKKKR
ncbi:MAG: hypothetical protein WC533_03625 [Candidatus Pacearchaeota archaeon]